MIKTACAGFSVAQSTYQSALPAVEVAPSSGARRRASTLERWRASAPAAFDFLVAAPRAVTHSERPLAQNGRHPVLRRGSFHDAADVRLAWTETLAMSETLKARAIVVPVPDNLPANADAVGRVHRFFDGAQRGSVAWFWEPPAAWPVSLVLELSRRLRLVPAFNPIERTGLSPRLATLKFPVRYFRLGRPGKTSGSHAFGEAELRDLKKACDAPLCYVVFNNGPTAYGDAVRFASLI